MQATCRINIGKDLGPYGGRGPFYTEQTEFGVKVGETYDVYGLAVYNDGLMVLVADERWNPDWAPREIFDIPQSKLPEDWYFAVHGPNALTEGRWVAEWGYEEFVGTLEASEALAEGTYKATVAFHERIRERRDPPPAYERIPSTPDEWIRATNRAPAGRVNGPQHAGNLLNTRQNELPLTEGRTYDVHGMALYNAVLIFLIEHESGDPIWTPHDLFAARPMRLPEDWHFAVHAPAEPEAVWGYEELVRSVDDFGALLHRQEDAVIAFRREVGRRRF